MAVVAMNRFFDWRAFSYDDHYYLIRKKNINQGEKKIILKNKRPE
jgi:hypothetical protein